MFNGHVAVTSSNVNEVMSYRGHVSQRSCVYGHVAVMSSKVKEVTSYRGHMFEGHVLNGHVAITSSNVIKSSYRGYVFKII